jgi:hypothetical protein
MTMTKSNAGGVRVERKVRPLSKTQSELLEAMKAGVIIHFMPYMGRFNPHSYYFRQDTHDRCTSAAEALIAKGFAELVGGYNKEQLVLIDRA